MSQPDTELIPPTTVRVLTWGLAVEAVLMAGFGVTLIRGALSDGQSITAPSPVTGIISIIIGFLVFLSVRPVVNRQAWVWGPLLVWQILVSAILGVYLADESSPLLTTFGAACVFLICGVLMVIPHARAWIRNEPSRPGASR